MYIQKIVVVLCMMVVFIKEAKSKLPSGISQHQYCAGCIATMKELVKRLSKRRLTGANREAKIVELLESICSPPHFVEYDYSPPKTVAACKLLLENHEEDIEISLTKDRKDIEQYICHTLSGACEGVDMDDKKKPKDLADIDLTSNDGNSVKIDPSDPKFTKKGNENNGKTLSKKDKKKTKKPKKKSTNGKQKQEKKEEKKKGSAFDQLKVDINDPAAMEKVMEQIKTIQKNLGNEKKDEL